MTRSRISAHQEMRYLNVKLAPGVPYNADAVREVITHRRTWFRLQPDMLETLKNEAEPRNLHTLGYLQMPLHKRYESLTAHQARSPPLVSNTGKRRWKMKGGFSFVEKEES